MTGWKPVLIIYILMSAVAATAYAAPGVEVNGDMKLSGTIGFPDSSKQSTAKTDCTGRYELNSNVNFPDGDGTVTDCRTGLIWLKNAKCTDTSNSIANPLGSLPWADASTWVAGLGNGLCGLHDGSAAGDWRLPTKTEWMAMVQSARNHDFWNPSLTDAAGTGQWTAGDIFDYVQSEPDSPYWSSSQFAGYVDVMYYASMYAGLMGHYGKNYSLYVWPVRSGQ